MSEKDIKIEMSSRFNETFIIQLLFGAAMIIIPLIYMLTPPIGFDFNLLFSIISGALLIFYAFRFYYVKNNLIERVEKAEKDVHVEAGTRLNETFIIQLLFGAAMIIIPLIYMLTPPIGFDFNLLFSIISGALLIFYAFRFYYVKNTIVDRIEKQST
ncbi:MAG: hypothetical protein HWN65_12945 [Candidatus Helarchaeota archaeon]|nr:hypothetical protein [Candidatus Helarchaeota archaeon]